MEFEWKSDKYFVKKLFVENVKEVYENIKKVLSRYSWKSFNDDMVMGEVYMMFGDFYVV